MESLIDEVKKNQTGDNEARYEGFRLPKIMVIGVGGAGNNSITRLYRLGIKGATTVAVNTDNLHLQITEADKKILIGKSLTHGLGAGGFPTIGEQCAELARETLRNVMDDYNLIFVTAGMGGGTGTGSTPVIAEIAKKLGAIVIGVVSTPFAFERARNMKAEEGIEKLRKVTDSVIVLDNNRLLSYVPDLPVEQALSVMDQIISEFVKGITETITQPSLINLDYADVKTIMTNGGVSMMLYGESKNQDPDKVVNDALNHPLLDVDYKGANGALVHITGGPTLSLKSAHKIADDLTKELDSNANVILGARIDPDFGEKIKVMAIMTGVRSPNIVGPHRSLQDLKTKIMIPKKDKKVKALELKDVYKLEDPEALR